MTRILPEIECGKVTRKTFSKIKEAIELPYLVKIQKDSYDAFIKEGIGEVLEDFSPITDYSDHITFFCVLPPPQVVNVWHLKAGLKTRLWISWFLCTIVAHTCFSMSTSASG